eukprot:gene12117-biopygen1757
MWDRTWDLQSQVTAHNNVICGIYVRNRNRQQASTDLAQNSMGSWIIQGAHHWVALAAGAAQECICWRPPQALDPIELGAGHRRCKNAARECGAGNRRCEEIRALALAAGADGPAHWRWHLALRLAPALGAGLALSLLALGWRWRGALALVWRWPIRR